ncbi:threonine/serine ThrE exporter family protein [Mobilicoccus caccae]|uniref:Membrane protein n=1 Tax=Mobilicoccus caccae TaxID=1859295 RepID=A0ABQ6IM95_9MICO|nr:threonine/serine exporter family protein [Mobilicoccus caccae]GMA38876.1 membrane protein [Mobilicoccus caccae]
MTEQFSPDPQPSAHHDYDKYEVNPTLTGVSSDPPSEVFEIVDQSVVEANMGSAVTAARTTPPQKIGAKTAFIRRAKSAVRAVDPPTWGLDLREISDGIEKARSRAVIDLAMRIAESTLSTGASAADVTANTLAVTSAYGLRAVHVDVTFTSIAVTHHRGAHEDPVTMVRIVRVRVADYDRLAATQQLISDIADGDLPLEDAQRRFFDIMGRPHLYRRWVITLSFVLLGGGVATLIGGRPLEILLAMLISGLVDRAMIWTGRKRVATFFAQMLGGAIPTVFATIIIALREHIPFIDASVRPSVLVATGIVILLAGLSVVGAAQDAIDGYYVTAAARTFEVVVLTLGILVGVLGTITLASTLGVPSYLIPPASLATSPVVQLIAVAFIAISYVLGCYARPRTILISVGMGLLGWTASLIVGELEVGGLAATALACVVVGFFSQPAAWMFRVPSLAISTAGIVAFLPGSMVYRGLYYLVEPAPVTTPSTDGPTLLWTAAGTGLAIAGGVSLGSYFGRQVKRDPRSAQARASARALRRGAAPVAD